VYVHKKKIDQQARKTRSGVDGHKYLSPVPIYALNTTKKKHVYITKTFVKYGGEWNRPNAQMWMTDGRFTVENLVKL